MINVDKKVVEVIAPQAIVNNGSFTANVIDTQGFRYLEVLVHIGALDIAITAMKLQESDVKASATSLTSGADIAGAVYGTSTNDAGSTSALPTATDDNKYFKFEIDLRGRKRYILPVITMGNGATGGFVECSAHLSRGEKLPASAAEKGCAQVLRVG